MIEISKYDDGGQLTTRGQLMQGSSIVGTTPVLFSSPVSVIARIRDTLDLLV